MFFFGKRKKKRSDPEEMAQNLLQKEGLEDSRQLQHNVLECCEQIMEASKEIENEKAEYRSLTDYLNDIQLIEELPAKPREEVYEAAKAIDGLQKSREELQKNNKSNITDAQFVQMQKDEKNIPDAIRRLQENETYQNMIKKDMGYLDGEKTEWNFQFEDLTRQQSILQKLIIGLTLLFVVVMIVLVTLQIGFRVETTFVWLWLVLFAAVSAFIIYIKMQSNQQEIQKSKVNANYAIQLLNKTKFKYVNVTNAVDYACEKYHVHNSYELNYIWEQYLLAVKEREKFRQANQDLEYYAAKLIRVLQQNHVKDPAIWADQAVALIDKKEMVEVKHDLIVRRQKVRGRIEYNTNQMRTQRDAIDELLSGQEMLPKEVVEIIASIDKLGSMNG